MMTLQTLLRLTRLRLGLAQSTPVEGGLFPTHIVLPPKPAYEVVTRTYNFLGALIGVLLLSPLMLAIAAAVKLTSPGPALYRGARVGRGEKTFHIYKFRTMKVGAEQQIGQRLVRQDEDHYTSIGRFLRKYRLDELAQLLNVLKGDMNLVGPRPLRPIFLEEHKRRIPGYARRFFVRPGITGQAQVRGGYYTRPRHKLFYDTLYIARRSVLLDLQLIALTFLRVMTRIFTTGFLLAWLLAMALVLPRSIRDQFLVHLGGTELNLLYLAPTLIALAHVLRREVTTGRIYALRTPVDLPLLGFLLITAALIPFSRFPFTSFRGLLWYVCNGVVVFYLVLNSRAVTDRRGTLIASLVGTVAAVGTVAMGKMIYAAVTTGEFVRLAGTVENPLILATLVAITLPLAIARTLRSRTRHRRLLYAAASLVLFATAALTLTRSGIIAVGLAVAAWFWRVQRAWVLRVVGVFALTLALLWTLGDLRLQPAHALRDLQAVAKKQAHVLENLTTGRLMVGVGARTLPNHVHRAQKHGTARSDQARQVEPVTHNAYLTLFIDHGPLGLAFFLWFLLGGLFFMVRSARQITDRVAREDLWATASGLTGCAVLLFFSDGLYSFPMMIVFWATMGLGIGIALNHRPGPRTFYRIVHYRHQL